MRPLRVLVIGSRLTGDLMIWDRLGRALTASPENPTILLHGAGEVTERILEGDGLSADLAGRDAVTDRAIIAALRQENRKAVQGLTDNGLPAVGFLGVDRELLTPGTARVRLLRQSADMGAVPVLGVAMGEPGKLSIPALADACEALAASDSGHFRLIWVTNSRVAGKISAAQVRELSGEISLPKASSFPNLSLRVLGVSEVGSVDPDRGAELVFAEA
ncbi:MAG: hypothetical protein JJ896_13710 [Rhodothermales bacterium]|nr:hypothetical protein [Rhodothermales bacterium]MBO6780705.1 hypothetical protein [Rhodothermales bacterium]